MSGLHWEDEYGWEVRNGDTFIGGIGKSLSEEDAARLSKVFAILDTELAALRARADLLRECVERFSNLHGRFRYADDVECSANSNLLTRARAALEE